MHKARLAIEAAFLFCLSAGLWAGNLERFALGDDASLKAGAVSASTHEPGAVYYNPAGLAGLERDSVDLGISAYAARYYRVPGLAQVNLPDQHGQLDFEGTSFFSTPAAVAYGFRLTPTLGLSFAIFTRDQLDLLGLFSQSFHGSNAGAPYDYEQGVELDFRAKNYLAGGGLGWALSPHLRIGASAFGEYLHQSVMTRFWGDYRDLNSYNPSTQIYSIRTNSSFSQRIAQGVYGLRTVAGLQWELGRGFTLGLVGRSPRFTAYQDATVDILLNGNTTTGPAIVQVHLTADGVAHPYVWAEPWQAHGALQWKRGRFDASAEVDASDRPDDEGRGTIWNWKLGLGYQLNERWDLGAGAYSDYSWGEPLNGFAQSNMDYHGGSLGLRWKREIGKGVTLSSTLSGHYERGTGEFLGAALNATNIVFPVPSVKTDATFEEANIHLASGLQW